MFNSLLTELQGSPLALAAGGFAELQTIIKQCVHPTSRTELLNLSGLESSKSSAEEKSSQSVLILPITGVMTKYGAWNWSEYYPGMDDIAMEIARADQDENLLGTILLMNTYGGSTQSWIRLEEVLRTRKKPVIAVVDGMCASAGVYVACFCDKILALNKTCKIGSIGVMAQLLDTSEAERKQGYRLLEFYPPESKYKNKAERDALDGNDKALIEETLSPLARHFQEVVRTQRPGLKQDTEGLLEGKMFFATDAMDAGLIDGICTMPEAIKTVCDIAKERDNILEQLKG